MNVQINVRLPDKLLQMAQEYTKTHGFSSLQELIKEALREKVYEDTFTQKETMLLKRLLTVNEKKDLYGTEEDLSRSLRKK